MSLLSDKLRLSAAMSKLAATPKPHAAAMRAYMKFAPSDAEETQMELITREYKKLVEVVREAPDFGGEPKTAFGIEYRKWLVRLRAELREVVGQ